MTCRFRGRKRFSPEFRDEAVKMVVVESRPIAEVAREIQVNGNSGYLAEPLPAGACRRGTASEHQRT
ncbi:transposase [Streptomyces olivoreticuli]